MLLRETLSVVVLSASGGSTAAVAERIASTGDVRVVAQVGDAAAAARAFTTHAARIVLLVADSATAPSLVTALMRRLRAPVVVLAATSKAAMDAMAAGALEAMPLDTPTPQIVESLRLMSSIHVIQRHPSRVSAPPRARGEAPMEESRLVAVGASTGGPPALAVILERLPPDLSAAIVVAQHMPDDYDESFATWLSSKTKLGVKVAEEGEPARPGTVYIAQGGRDLILGPGRQLSNVVPAAKGPVPSADRLLESASRLIGVGLFGAVLTGMGRDGAVGLLAMRKAGAETIVQDARSCVVSSMPNAALAHGAAHDALPPAAIADRIIAFAERR